MQNCIKKNYTVKNENLDRVTEIKDLRVITDSKLTFKSHINKISSNAKKAFGFIMRNNKIFRKIETLRMLYFALVRSQLEFASVVWNPTTECNNKQIEGVQRKFLR